VTEVTFLTGGNLNKGIYVAASGGIMQERVLDVISNNLANMNTRAFKVDRMTFSSYLKKPATVADQLSTQSRPPSSLEIKNGYMATTQNDSVYMMGSKGYTDFSQGLLQKTGNPLDVAIDGSGFMAVDSPNGERFTRGGSLKIDQEGLLVTSEGYPVLDENSNPINIGESPFVIRADGAVMVNQKDVLAKIKMVDFPDKSVVEKIGTGLYKTTDDSQGEPSTALMTQGFLEGSNINPVGEMSRMIMASRAYDAFQKTVHSNDDMDQSLTNNVLRT
jgi:flagellar basal-body rod protein FlgF